MDNQKETNNQQLGFNDYTSLESSDRIEDLRRILKEEQDRQVSYREANEVGESLLSFFQVLAEDNTGTIYEVNS